MNRYIMVRLAALVIVWLAVVLPAGKAVGQQAESSLKNQLLGTWTLASNFTNHEDGSKVDILGPNPTGMLMFDGGGHISVHEMRSDLPKFGSNSREGTEAENIAIVRGSICYFGTYTVDEAAKTLNCPHRCLFVPELGWGRTKTIFHSLKR